MAITPITQPSAPSQPQDRSLSWHDKVLRSLQIANQVFNIPVAFAEWEKSKADTERIQADTQRIGALQEKTEAETEFLPEKNKLEKQRLESTISSQQASADLAKARVEDLKARRQERADKLDRDLAKGIGSDVISFQESAQAQKNISRILEGRIMQRALANGSGPATFIAQIGLIRGQAGDVGPALARELNASLDRQGLAEKAKGLVDRWFGNQAITAEEAKILSKVVTDISAEARSTLTDLERDRARVLSKKYNITVDEAEDALDSREFINAASQESIKKIMEKKDQSPSKDQIKKQLKDTLNEVSKVVTAGVDVSETGTKEATQGLLVGIGEVIDDLKDIDQAAAAAVKDIIKGWGQSLDESFGGGLQQDIETMSKRPQNQSIQPPQNQSIQPQQQAAPEAAPAPKSLKDLIGPKKKNTLKDITGDKKIIQKRGTR